MGTQNFSTIAGQYIYYFSLSSFLLVCRKSNDLNVAKVDNKLNYVIKVVCNPCKCPAYTCVRREEALNRE